MRYVRLDTELFQRPAILDAGQDARLLFIAGLCYCSQYHTGGTVPEPALRILQAETGIANAQEAAARLIAVGIWERAEKSIRIKDWLGCSVIYDDTPLARRLWNRLRAQLAPQVYARDGYCCQYCGATAPLTVDHIVPLAHGGTNALDNLTTACRPCNSSKHAKSLEAWRV